MSEISLDVPRNTLKRLTVKATDGSTILSMQPTRRIKLVAGRGVLITGDPGSDTISMSSPSALRGHDPYYVRKYRDVLYGRPDWTLPTADPWIHASYRFSEYTEWPHASSSSSSSSEKPICARYIASINKMTPHRLDGTFFMESSACWQIGCLGDAFSSALNTVSSNIRGLYIENKCMPSVDCRDYWVLYEMMERLRMFLQTNRDKNCCEEGSYKLFEQYKATVHYWNYLMYRKKAGVTARALRAGIAVSARYEHLCCNPTCSAAPGAVPEGEGPGWTCFQPLVFHMRVERLTCQDVPLKYTLYVTDVSTNPRNLNYATAEFQDRDSTFSSSSSSSESSSSNVSIHCDTTGSSFEIYLSMLDVLQFRDFVEGQITIGVTIPDGAKTSETLAKLYQCGGAEGAVKFKIQTEWVGVCPVNTYAEEEIWVKLLMDEMDVDQTTWACEKSYATTPFLQHCGDYGVLVPPIGGFETTTTVTGADVAAVQASADSWCLAEDVACPSEVWLTSVPCGCFRGGLNYDPLGGVYWMSVLHCCS